MAAAIGVITPGQGHAGHNHDGVEEIIYFLSGEAEQMVKYPGYIILPPEKAV